MHHALRGPPLKYALHVWPFLSYRRRFETTILFRFLSVNRHQPTRLPDILASVLWSSPFLRLLRPEPQEPAQAVDAAAPACSY